MLDLRQLCNDVGLRDPCHLILVSYDSWLESHLSYRDLVSYHDMVVSNHDGCPNDLNRMSWFVELPC